MSTAQGLVLVAIVAIATYAMRAGMILLLSTREIPAPVVRSLRYVGPAVLAALVVTLTTDPDAPSRGVTVAEVAGLAAAGPVALKTRNLIPTLVAGMAMYWLVRALV